MALADGARGAHREGGALMHGYDKRTPGEAMDTECIPWPPPPPTGWFGDTTERPDGQETSFADFFNKGPSSSTTD